MTNIPADGSASTVKTAMPSFGSPTPSPDVDRLQPGTRLNDVFEIIRFIATGGMGAVYEGVNISSGERTAIKVLLPSLLHDSRSWEMFRREANVLTRLSHPAIVQYRVLAQDSRVGVPYIATEFIDGGSLGDALTGRRASLTEVLLLLRRLAEGLARAHSLGAVHRDLSPDNVLLPGGQVHEAKIIDFGIAKDLDPGTATIIGSGFAGKLGYCAPEQLGDYGQTIGPWTDVYSLGLMIYSFAVGKAVEMGVTLSQAVDRRRRGVDMDDLPEGLRPLLAAMLQPDPAQRLRSMEDVLRFAEAVPLEDPAPTTAAEPVAKPARGKQRPVTAAPAAPTIFQPTLDVAAAAASSPQTAESVAADARSTSAPSPSPYPSASAATTDEGAGAEAPRSRMGPVLVGAGVLAAIGVAAVVGVFALVGRHRPTPAVHPAAAPAALLDALSSGLMGADCSLLQIQSLGEGHDGVSVVLTGATNNPPQVSSLLGRAVRAKGISALQMDDVAPAPAAMCPAINAARPASRALMQSPNALTSAQHEYEISRQPDGGLSAKSVVTFSPAAFGGSSDLFLVGPDGAVTPLGHAAGAAFAPASAAASPGAPVAETLGDGHVRLTASLGAAGLYGVLALGRPGAQPPSTAAGLEALRQLAATPGARSAGTWFTVVDNVPNTDVVPGAPGNLTAPGTPAPSTRHKVKANAVAPSAPTDAKPEKKDDLNGLY